MTDTPETEAQLTTFTSISKNKKHFENKTGTVNAEFARKLELERNTWEKECEILAGMLGRMADLYCESVAKSEKLQEEVDRLTAEYRDSED
jgi:hypothetical protein